jgi:hypothetical protein
MKRFFALSVIALAFFAATANAQPVLNYNFFDGRYTWTEFDDSAEGDAQGLASVISISPMENFFFEGGYNYDYVDPKGTARHINVDTFRYGAGAYLPLNEQTHLVGRVGGLHFDARADGNYSDDGVYASAAARMALTPEFELAPIAEYTYVDSDGVWEFGVDALYDVYCGWALVGGVALNEDSDVRLEGGARFAW